MALTIFLFQVTNLEFSKGKSEIFVDDEEQATRTVNEENPIFLCAKTTFRGIYVNQQHLFVFLIKLCFFFFLQELVFGQIMFPYKMEQQVLLHVEINQKNLILI